MYPKEDACKLMNFIPQDRNFLHTNITASSAGCSNLSCGTSRTCCSTRSKTYHRLDLMIHTINYAKFHLNVTCRTCGELSSLTQNCWYAEKEENTTTNNCCPFHLLGEVNLIIKCYRKNYAQRNLYTYQLCVHTNQSIDITKSTILVVA